MAQQTPTSNSVKALRARGDQVWARMPKCNAEFFRLTYGALVVQLVEDCDDIKEGQRQTPVNGCVYRYKNNRRVPRQVEPAGTVQILG